MDERTFRIELRNDGEAVVIDYSDAVDAAQSELSARAASLADEGLKGELVLIEQASNTILAKRILYPQPIWAKRLRND